jgi:hypothetical protein
MTRSSSSSWPGGKFERSASDFISELQYMIIVCECVLGGTFSTKIPDLKCYSQQCVHGMDDETWSKMPLLVI